MKKSLLLLTFVLTSVAIPVKAQQVNVYQTCTTYKENYIPGYYDRYGNYVQGTVTTQTYSASCGNVNYSQPVVVAQPVAPVYANNRYRRGYCSPARTTLGGLLGGGIAAAASKKSAWSWSIPLGAVLGTGAANATCY